MYDPVLRLPGKNSETFITWLSVNSAYISVTFLDIVNALLSVLLLIFSFLQADMSYLMILLCADWKITEKCGIFITTNNFAICSSIYKMSQCYSFSHLYFLFWGGIECWVNYDQLWAPEDPPSSCLIKKKKKIMMNILHIKMSLHLYWRSTANIKQSTSNQLMMHLNDKSLKRLSWIIHAWILIKLQQYQHIIYQHCKILRDLHCKAVLYQYSNKSEYPWLKNNL